MEECEPIPIMVSFFFLENWFGSIIALCGKEIKNGS